MFVEFVKSIYKIEDYTSFNLPEIAFSGKSNVGKSTLINALFQCKIAHTSKRPGKTKCINFYNVEKKFIVADLPGYGYASVPKKMQDDWKALIESYITTSKLLKKVFVLVDVKRGIEEKELQLMDWLSYINKPFKVIFTKIDKVNKNELLLAKKRYENYTPLYFSSLTKEGKKEIFAEIKGALCI